MATVTEPMAVTIYSEARRGVLVRALWNAAVQALGNNENEFVWLDDNDDKFEEIRDEVDARVSAYDRWIRDILKVRTAALGDSVELWGELGDRVLGLRSAVADSPEELLNAAPEERARTLELFDAAYTLLLAEEVA